MGFFPLPIYFNILIVLMVTHPTRKRCSNLNCIRRFRTCLPRVTHLLTAYTAFTASSTFNTPMRFDSDSYPIMVDNCASASITNNLNDFIQPPRVSNKYIQGISGDVAALKVGTAAWPILDDQGCRHMIYLPDTYYAPNAPYRLLSPQHWSQIAKDHWPERNGTWCATYSNTLVLWWKQQRYKRTVQLGANNVAVLYSAPGTQCFAHSAHLLE